MSEEVKKPEMVTIEVPKPNQFQAALANELKEEYDECKAEYKAAKKMAKTVAERRTIMRMYQDSLIDFATESRILQDWEFNSAINQEIDALNRRLSTGRRSW
tara:strand:+ start:72 stop:377 length:306 start_codon:yes stop_codon:yes gene_type:complete